MIPRERGQEIRRYRLARGISQRKLAHWVGCSQNTIHLLETGQMAGCTPKLAHEIEQALGAPTGSLFDVKAIVRVPKVPTARPATRRKAVSA